MSIDKISKQSTENDKTKEHVQELRSEIKLLIRESRWKESFYLRRSVRNSYIKEKAQSEIDKYGKIQNVAGNGNCGIYSTMEGLSQVIIECTMDVSTFIKEVCNYVWTTSHQF